MARQSSPSLRLIRKAPCVDAAICPADVLENVVRPVLETLGIVYENEPVHLRVFGAWCKTAHVGTQLHRTTAHIPPGSFDSVVETDSDTGLALKEAGVRIFIDGPCLCVLGLIQENLSKTSAGQLARRLLPFAQGLTLASEFCVTYACDPARPRHGWPQYQIPPALAVQDMKGFCDKVGKVAGASVLRDITLYLSSLHASPMEVLVYALAVLRPSLGGLGLPRPEVNEPLDLSPKQLKMISRRQITPDLYWKAYEEAVEYDVGDHNTEEAVTHPW